MCPRCGRVYERRLVNKEEIRAYHGVVDTLCRRPMASAAIRTGGGIRGIGHPHPTGSICHWAQLSPMWRGAMPSLNDSAVYLKDIKDNKVDVSGLGERPAIIAVDRHGNESAITTVG